MAGRWAVAKPVGVGVQSLRHPVERHLAGGNWPSQI